MSAFSSAAWVIHDLGLAAAVGGPIFAKAAFHPAIAMVRDPAEKDRVVDEAWKRFNKINLISHAAVAASWLIGRKTLSGRVATQTARQMTLAKDALVAASLATGVTTMILAGMLGKRVRRGEGPSQPEITSPERIWAARKLERTALALGSANMVANAAVMAVTTLLAMESSKSRRFGFVARRLP